MLALTHRYCCPFTGAILAGVFTDGALNQLRSLGFHVLFFPYESIIEAFQAVGVDAHFDEDTPEREFRKKLSRWKGTSQKARRGVAARLVEKHRKDTDEFLSALDNTVKRCVERIIVIPLHGRQTEYSSVGEAIAFLSSYESSCGDTPMYKYEIQIRYSSGDKITAEFTGKDAALKFLKGYE